MVSIMTDLLVRVLVGDSSHRLSARFLVDRLTVDNIIHGLETRYPMVFRYLAEATAQGLKRGYIEQEGMRRYFDGLGSSSIEKRNSAQRLARQWLLQF
jgi:DNA polymerase I-like protein with 3'-5' exonuclease and polymerase domains